MSVLHFRCFRSTEAQRGRSKGPLTMHKGGSTITHGTHCLTSPRATRGTAPRNQHQAPRSPQIPSTTNWSPSTRRSSKILIGPSSSMHQFQMRVLTRTLTPQARAPGTKAHAEENYIDNCSQR